MKITRREAIGGLAAMTAGAAAGCAASPDPGGLPIIDTHLHLWDLTQFQPPWLRTAGPLLERNYVTADYRKAARGLNVVGAVYLEIDVAPKDHAAEAEHAIHLSRSSQHAPVAAVISGRPGTKAFGAHARRFAKSAYIKGVRQVLTPPSTPRGICLEPRFVENMRLLGELGLSFDLCMRPGELADGRKLAATCPDTRFVLDHCGNPDLKDAGSRDQWKRNIAEFARLSNVACKISGIIAGVPREGWGPELLAPVIDHCLDSFGPDRVIFGSDWPVCLLGATLSTWVKTLREVIRHRPVADQRKLFHDNALNVYRLG